MDPNGTAAHRLHRVGNLPQVVPWQPGAFATSLADTMDVPVDELEMTLLLASTEMPVGEVSTTSLLGPTPPGLKARFAERRGDEHNHW